MLYPCDAAVLIFSGKDTVKFLNSVSTNLIEFSTDRKHPITTSICNNKGQLVNHLTIFQIGDVIPAICHMAEPEGLIDFLNPKILSQDVNIRDISNLNVLEYQISEDHQNDSISKIQSATIVPLIQNLQIKLTPRADWIKSEYVSMSEWNNWRVENIYPTYPQELSRNLTPYNCGLGDYVHNSKGCYVGQEILTRMYSRNSFGKTLKRVKNESSQPKFTTTVGVENCLEISK
jgi:folate-binding protein YgfZ